MVQQIINTASIIDGASAASPYTAFITQDKLFINTARYLYINYPSEISTLAQTDQFIYVYKLSNVKNIASNDLADLKINMSDMGNIMSDGVDISELEQDAVIVKINTGSIENHKYIYLLAYDINKMQDKFYNLLTNYCSTCIDKAQKERILTAFFRYTLMRQAEEIQDIETAAKLYLDLDRILNLNDHCKTECIDNCNPCSNCNTCKNGVCSL